MKYFPSLLSLILIFFAENTYAQLKLYGATLSGGATNDGLIFEINSDGSGFKILRNINSATDGKDIWGSPLYESNVLFGHTFQGGVNGAGTIFQLSTEGDFQVIKKLDSVKDGYNPMGSLIKASNGFLYGMTHRGGTNNDGTIYKLKPDGSEFTVLKHFSKITDGGWPYGKLVIGKDNKLYGMTSAGGYDENPLDYGTIFRLNLDGEFEVIKKLSYQNGQFSFGSLLVGSDGLIYGIGRAGGEFDRGTIFKLNPQNLQFSVIHSFKVENGYNSYGSLIESSNGLLVGMNRDGGPDLLGTIFTIKKDGSDFKVIHNFNGSSDGGNPRGDLVEGPDGTLYGLTYQGGAFDAGTIFKIKIDGTGFLVLKNFNPATDGKNPRGSLVLGDLVTGFNPSRNEELTIYPNPSNGDVSVNSEISIHELFIYDITGKKVASAAMIKQYNVNLSPGVYLFRIKVGGQLKSRKVIVTN